MRIFVQSKPSIQAENICLELLLEGISKVDIHDELLIHALKLPIKVQVTLEVFGGEDTIIPYVLTEPEQTAFLKWYSSVRSRIAAELRGDE